MFHVEHSSLRDGSIKMTPSLVLKGQFFWKGFGPGGRVDPPFKMFHVEHFDPIVFPKGSYSLDLISRMSKVIDL